MRLIQLPAPQTVALIFLLWPIFQLIPVLFCRFLPDSTLSPGGPLFRPRRWERGGRLYEGFFRIRTWKRFLPDGGAIHKRGYSKRHLRDFSAGNLGRFLTESCRAELSHWLAIPPFALFAFFTPLKALPFMLAYAIAVNAPCIVAQRYNRPRIGSILSRRRGGTERRGERG